MANKLKLNPFDDNQEQDDSYRAVTASFFGQVGQASRNVIAKPIDIFEITPDPAQPRRAIPSAVRAAWDGKTDTVSDMLAHWMNLVEITPNMYLDPDPDFERPAEVPPQAETLIKLLADAATIRRDGLSDPIIVVRHGDGYQIEDGERRWLAHHLLYAYTDDEKWRKIPARVEDRLNVWRQASSNGARASLNAIGKARQLAILLMDLYAGMGIVFAPFDEMVAPGGCDRAYYAQVADGAEYRIPRGQGEALLGAIGLKDPSQLRQYRALLRLSDELWQRADDENLDEFQIRTLSQQRKHTVTPVTVSKPITVRIPPQLSDKWAQVRQRLPKASEADVIDTLLDFYLSHQA